MKKKILVADDSITIQKVVELTFAETKYEVVCAGNGAVALQRIAEGCPDLALLDAVMPERTGYDVCASLKADAATSWVPVILLSGAFEPFDEKKARAAGADGHLKKPFESKALVAKVTDLMVAHPRPGADPDPEPEPEAAPPPPAPAPAAPAGAHSEIFAKVPAGPATRPDRPDRPAEPPPDREETKAAAPPVPRDQMDRAVREAVAQVSEKIVREIAWEVIPDLAESIIRRRIREIEQEAENGD